MAFSSVSAGLEGIIARHGSVGLRLVSFDRSFFTFGGEGLRAGYFARGSRNSTVKLLRTARNQSLVRPVGFRCCFLTRNFGPDMGVVLLHQETHHVSNELGVRGLFSLHFILEEQSFGGSMAQFRRKYCGAEDQ